ncbi:MAG: phosphate transport system regulatory protein PhoU [Planctomycetes bacterium TMED75]|nr:phosphate transport system regulatory protein PhoU [Planctomycetaceae bacterium]OUU93918.1 MAG: phosphate transport system regulatory protein PhoU [Planctomycetes bacterium TMED75]
MSIDLHNDLLALRRDLLALSALVEQQVSRTIEAMTKSDAELAREVKGSDTEVDAMDLRIEEQCMRLLALGSPMAGDLRQILSTLRISGQLERIADLAKGISKRTIKLSKLDAIRLPSSLLEMAEATRKMIADALVALSNEDVELCRQVRHADNLVDNLNKEVLHWSRNEIPRNVENTNAAIHLLTIAQRLERICDITTLIVEEVIFQVEGRIVRHGVE